MLENQTEHTFIVTVDIATIKQSRKDERIVRAIHQILHDNWIRDEDAKETGNKGGYFLRKMKI